ncbi:hypothetical protein Gogos_009056 [Gossypium gossypioides]|uniref:Uncharacterized protein n=1 Tax=Gossypium gossypioides TaxID=34282 RepID=A0A7J9CDU2_GOSGO|nr:hypothetical protein [Gossypium gossypioides]
MFGASDSYIFDKKMLITITFNHFGTGLVQRSLGVDLVLFMSSTMTTFTGSYMPLVAPATIQLSSRAINIPRQGYHFENSAYYTPFDDPNVNKLFNAYKMIPFQPCQLVLELTNIERILEEKKKGLGPLFQDHYTNLVDSCWRYDPNLEKNKKWLANSAPGFAPGTNASKEVTSRGLLPPAEWKNWN